MPESSPSTDGLADLISAFRIWTADAHGASLTRRAAAPATVGAANEVPDSRLVFPSASCTKLANPFATRSGLHRPSAVGPRELIDHVWCCPHASGCGSQGGNGRTSRPKPTP